MKQNRYNTNPGEETNPGHRHKCVHIKIRYMEEDKRRIIPIELSQEDKKLLELQKEDMNKLMEMIIQASKIPSKYFDSNSDEK